MSPARARQVRNRPETLVLACLMAAVGGYLDAWTFLWRGVFANAQTGNVVLMAIAISRAEWHQLVLRVWPMLAYLGGVLAAQVLATGTARRMVRRPARLVLGLEITTLAALALVGEAVSTPVLTSVVSFIAALQVTTFKAVGEYSYTTTMATGNLRTMVASAFAALVDRDRHELEHAVVMGTIVTAFATGACLGGLATIRWRATAAWLVVALLVVALVLLVADTRRHERQLAAHRAEDETD